MASKLRQSYLPEIKALGIRRSGPQMLSVNLTRRCNQQCIYCEIHAQEPATATDVLRFQDMVWLLDEMHKNSIPKISLCGGEPFLYRDLYKVIEYAGEKNIRCSVTSNGMQVHLQSEANLQLLKKYKTEVNISVDSFEESLQGFTRGNPLALPNALRSIETLQQHDIPLTLLTVITRYNRHCLAQHVETAAARGIRQVLFQPVIRASNYPGISPLDQKNDLNVDAEDIPELLHQFRMILQLERKLPIRTNIYRLMPWIAAYLDRKRTGLNAFFFQAVLKKFYCRELDAIIDISFDGNIQACGLVASGVSVFDAREKGLIRLWNEATAVAKHQLKHNTYYPECDACCHHFSRNMLASIFKYPLRNYRVLLQLTPLILRRMMNETRKRLP